MPVLLFENFPVTIVSQGNVPVYQSPIGYPPSSGLYPTEILLQVKCKPEEAQENVADQEFKFIAGRHVVRLFARGKEYDEQPMDDGLVCYSALVNHGRR